MDIKGLLSDPDFQKLDASAQREVLSRIDPAFKDLTDAQLSEFQQKLVTPHQTGGTTSGFHHGFRTLKGPGEKEVAGAPVEGLPDWQAEQAHRALSGIATAAAPALLPTALAQPGMTAIGVGSGGLAQQLVSGIGSMLGYPGFGDLAGDAAGIGAGFKAPEIAERAGQLASNPQMRKALIDMIPYWGSRINKISDIMSAVPPVRPNLGPGDRSPIWQGMPASEAGPLPAVDPIQSALPSGRVPGQPASPQPTPQRSPLWTGMPTPTPESLPNVSPIHTDLPSGRIPGQPVPKTPPPAREPLWNGMATPTPESLPDISPIPTDLPSGRIPGQPAPKTPPPTRIPMWNGIATSAPEPLPDVQPIPSQLPSGRLPGPAPATPAKPREPLWKAMPTPTPASLPDVNPIQGSLPSGRVPGQPSQGPQSVPFESTMKPLPSIDKFEMNRMAHARAQEMNLPGSPAGRSAHPQLSQAAKDLYGVDSWSKLSVDQMKSIHDFMDSKGRLPLKGELR